MAWRMSNGSPTQGFYFGSDALLIVNGDLSIGIWVRFQDGAAGTVIQAGAGSLIEFYCLNVHVMYDAVGGWGLRAEHQLPSSANAGVTCIPGLIDPKFKITSNVWKFFGFARAVSAPMWVSFFGDALTMFDGPTASYSVQATGGGPNFSFGVGTIYLQNQPVATPTIHANNIDLGPLVYYKRALTKAQFLSAAGCGPLPADLLIWSKLLSPVTDLSTYAWPVQTNGPPLNLGLDLCARGSGAYRLCST